MSEAIPDVVIERKIAAPPRKVFEAWLDPQALKRFMFPTAGAGVALARCDARVGGQFVIVMTVGGDEKEARGEYLEIKRYSRIEFTWLSCHAGSNSRVTLLFSETADGHTQLTLEHRGLPSLESCNGHRNGWAHILEALSVFEAIAA
jgi:uncharacterized protein YndB with AHSA1/START domain